MKKIVFVFAFLYIISVQVDAQWYVQNTIYNNNLNKVCFIDPNNGWICGDGGLILHTTNRGIDWTKQTSGTDNALTDIKFVTSQIGWVIGASGIILFTNNGGSTWNIQQSGVTSRLIALSAIDTEYCWISGTQGILLNTKDGGNTWTLYNQFPSQDRTTVHFINRNIGWAGGHNAPPMMGRSIYKTTNGGTNWFYQYSSANQLINLFFINENYGWATGEPSRLQVTTNSGGSWSSRTFSQAWQYSNGVYFFSNNIGWISSYYISAYIWFTFDGGNNWTLQYESPNFGSSMTSDIHFVDKKYGWLVGLNGLIVHTDNGGGVFPSTPLLIAPENNQQLISDTVNLIWSSATPQITGYELFLSSDSLFLNTIDTLITDTTIILANLEINTKYYWKVKAKNQIGYGDESVVFSFKTSVTDVKATQTFPFEFSLSQNYPNPFNPSTNIQYAISNRQFVTLKVYDVLGKEVATLVNEEKPAGKYNVEFRMQNFDLSSGIYFYQLKAGDFIETKKMILIK